MLLIIIVACKNISMKWLQLMLLSVAVDNIHGMQILAAFGVLDSVVSFPCNWYTFCCCLQLYVSFQIKVLSNDPDSLHFAIATILQLFKMYYDKDKKEVKLPQLRVS